MNTTSPNATGGTKAGGGERTRNPALLDVRAVAALLDCSPRHVYRLSDAGYMPPPLRLGGLVRWNLAEIDCWISDGCPALRAKDKEVRHASR